MYSYIPGKLCIFDHALTMSLMEYSHKPSMNKTMVMSFMGTEVKSVEPPLDGSIRSVHFYSELNLLLNLQIVLFIPAEETDVASSSQRGSSSSASCMTEKSLQNEMRENVNFSTLYT